VGLEDMDTQKKIIS